MRTIKDKGLSVIITNTQDAITYLKVATTSKDLDVKLLINAAVLLAEKINADLIDIWTRLDIMVH
jgi:hypothetical protein